MRQHKRARAKCCLGLANGKAALADGGGLLVTRHTGNADWPAKMLRQCRAKIACTVGYFGQYVARYAEQVGKSVVPSAAANRHQRCARCVGCIGDMAATRQAKYKIAFDRANREMRAGIL